MADIFINRRVGRHAAGTILNDVELDAYWIAHVSAANATLLDTYDPIAYADDDEDFVVADAAVEPSDEEE